MSITGEPVGIKWGTREPVLALFDGASDPVPVRAYGQVSARFVLPPRPPAEGAGVPAGAEPAGLQDQVRELVVQSLCETLPAFSRPDSVTPAWLEEVAARAQPGLSGRLGAVGLALEALAIGNITFGEIVQEQEPQPEYQNPLAGALNMTSGMWQLMMGNLDIMQAAPPSSDVIMSSAEAAAYLHLTEAQVIALIESGELAGERTGAGVCVAKSRLDEWLARRAQTAS
jgi:excisionase family DNA binding protein